MSVYDLHPHLAEADADDVSDDSFDGTDEGHF